MARWNKGYAVPLDSLIKEKENTNRPIAARSAGTVGKWGKMGFTSTRTYALKNQPPVAVVVDPAPYSSASAVAGGGNPAANSPDDINDCTISANEPPKPRKFFKSRNLTIQTNSVFISHLPRAPPSPEHQSSSPPKHEPPLKLKIAKAKLERKKSLSVDRERDRDRGETNIVVVNKSKKKKKEEKILKPEAPPSRVITRTRRVVNYNEDDDDRSETPLRDIIRRLSPVAMRKESPLAVEREEKQRVEVDEQMPVAVEQPVAPKTPAVEHPPIVLRISKGTSRLISTDSEEILNSPVHEAQPQIDQPTPVPDPVLLAPPAIEEPPPPLLPPLKPNRIILRRNESKGDNEFVATVSPPPIISVIEPPAPVRPVSKTPPVVDPPPPVKHESLKIVIKANALERPEKRGKSKRHHKTASGHRIITDHVFKTPSPQPGSENYDLYRTLTGSPSERDFDSQSSILGSISSKENSQFPAAMPDDACVIRSRGSSDVTSDIDTSQHSSLVAVPSDIESRLESMMDCDEDEPGPAERHSDTANMPDRLDAIPEEPLKEDILELLTDGQERTKSERILAAAAAATKEPIVVNIMEPAQNGEMKQDEIDGGKADIVEERVTTRRTRSRAATAAVVAAAPKVEEPKEVVEEAPTGRVTRNNNNGSLKNKKTPATSAKAAPAKSAAASAKSATSPTKPVAAAAKPSAAPTKPTAAPTKPTAAPAKPTPDSATKLPAKPAPAAPTMRSYSRKRKAPSNAETFDINSEETNLLNATQTIETSTLSIDLPEAPPIETRSKAAIPSVEKIADTVVAPKPAVREYKVKNKIKRAWESTDSVENRHDEEQFEPPPAARSRTANNSSDRNVTRLGVFGQFTNNNVEATGDNDGGTDDQLRSVKLVISKKKGSIFKSRALIAEQGNSTKRHVYKHTWDADKDKSQGAEDSAKPKIMPEPTLFDDDDFNDDDGDTSSPATLMRFTRPNTVNRLEPENVTSVKCDKRAKDYYTVVRNVKTAHQIQESGEYQEMDDDVQYLLDTMQSDSSIPARCLSALQVASKCMTPAFRMHVRAHGTAPEFFKALKDAQNDVTLSLCTATIMFVLSQDRLNMDLDRDSLELLLNLLESSGEPSSDDVNYERNKQRVREICEEIKSQGKAIHLNLDNISTGVLAMETLLSLTSQRAGEWYKEELRKLGGLEYVINTICECCGQISDYVVSWTNVLLDKLRTIGRCLRVLENVSEMNGENQKYILAFGNGKALSTLFKLYKLCDSEIALYPTSECTPKQEPGVVLRETLVPLLKVLINVTHAFSDQAEGAAMLGQHAGIFDTSFHILLQAPNYVPDSCVFDLSILVLSLLINLTMHTVANRNQIIKAHAPSDFGNQFDKVPAIKALIEYFYNCERNASLAEENTNAILEKPAEKTKFPNSQEQLEQTVTMLLKKAGHHMEHTMKASYAGMLIVYLILNNEENEKVIRSCLKDASFKDIISVLEKYYNFVNLTASSDATSHIQSTKKLIDYVKNCETHSKTEDQNAAPVVAASSSNQITINSPSTSKSMSTRSTPRVYKTYSQR